LQTEEDIRVVVDDQDFCSHKVLILSRETLLRFLRDCGRLYVLRCRNGKGKVKPRTGLWLALHPYLAMVHGDQRLGNTEAQLSAL
jgi:hypothetical protein